MNNWISVEDKLPEKFGTWREYLITMLYPRDVEVIGNIYDNPELIGGRTNE